MAKFVIAGSADCPYYAKAELLGDKLARNLPDFQLHKIVIQPNEWQSWLENMCNERGWSHSKSPITWRELVDRGGKGMLIGGANEFQEYALAYYGIKSTFQSTDMTTIGQENRQTKDEIDQEDAEFRAQSNPLHVCVTSATGGVAYGLINALAQGDCLGKDIEISLRLLDTEENQSALSGVQMETVDLNHPLLRNVEITSDPKVAFSDASVIIILDELEQGEEEPKEEFLVRNKEHFVAYAELIDTVTKPDVKVMVSGKGPVNFIVHMMLDNMSNIPAQNVVGTSRTVENRAKSVVAQRLNVNSAGIADLTVWGNINGTHVIDASKARVHNYDGAIWGPPSFSVSATEMVHDAKWLSGEFVTLVAERQSQLETSMKHRSCMAESSAIATLLGHWCQGAPQEQFFSLAVRSQGDYDIPEGLVCSLPVRFSKMEGWTLVKDLDISEELKEPIQNAVKDLQEETYAIYPRPKPPTPEREPSPPPDAPPAEPNADGQAKLDDGNTDENQEKSGEEEDPNQLEKITEDKEGEEQEAKEDKVPQESDPQEKEPEEKPPQED